jgi:hypothetical protein
MSPKLPFNKFSFWTYLLLVKNDPLGPEEMGDEIRAQTLGKLHS